MFNKSNSQNKDAAKPTSMAGLRTETPAPAAAEPAAPQVRKAPRVASMISADLVIDGNVSGDGELQVDGLIRGDVRVLRLTIGETGRIEGSIIAETVENRGKVAGGITAKQVKLMGSCFVDGDITHEQLMMESGAFFQGRSLKFQRQQAQPAAAPALSAVPTPMGAPASAIVDAAS